MKKDWTNLARSKIQKVKQAVLTSAVVFLSLASFGMPVMAEGQKVVSSETTFSDQKYTQQLAPTSKSTITQKWPSTVTVTLDDGSTDQLTISGWTDDGYKNKKGVYTFTPTFNNSKGYDFGDETWVPTGTVRIGTIKIAKINSKFQDKTFSYGEVTTFKEIQENLGTTMNVTTEDDKNVNVSIEWSVNGTNMSIIKPGKYTLQAWLDGEIYSQGTIESEGSYSISDNIRPQVTVTIDKSRIVSTNYTPTAANITVPVGKSSESISESLAADVVTGTNSKGKTVKIPVVWESSNYNGNQLGTYTFTAKLVDQINLGKTLVTDKDGKALDANGNITTDPNKYVYTDNYINSSEVYDISDITLPSVNVTVSDINIYAGKMRPLNKEWGEQGQEGYKVSGKDTILTLPNLDNFSQVKQIAVTSASPSGDYVDIGYSPYSYSVGHNGHWETITVEWTETSSYEDGRRPEKHYGEKSIYSGCDRCGGGPDGTCYTEHFDYTSHVYVWFDDTTGTLYFQNGDYQLEKPTFPDDISYLFSGWTSLNSVDLSAFNCTEVTNNTEIFNNCTALTTITLGTDWKFTDVSNSGLEYANYPSDGKGFWHKDDKFTYKSRDKSEYENQYNCSLNINDEDETVETSLGYIDVYSLASYSSFDEAKNALGFSDNDRGAYEFVRFTTGASKGEGSNNLSVSYNVHRNGSSQTNGFEDNYNNARSEWNGTWITGLGTTHRYWKTEGVANVNNMIEIHHPEDPFTTYCWAQHRGPNSGWYDRLEVTTEKQMITNLEVYHQNYRPLPSEVGTDSPMRRSFITIMYYGDITENHIDWKGLSAQQRAYATMSAVQYCSDHANYSYGNPHGVVDQILNKKYDDIPNVQNVHFYIYLSTHEGGGQQQMGANSVQFQSYGGVEIRKYDTAGNPLQGAEFTVYTDKDCTKPLKLGNGDTCVITTNSEGLASACEMDELGGIPAGATYYIKETKAPDASYNVSSDVFEFTVRKDRVTSVGKRNANTSKETMSVIDESKYDIRYGYLKFTKKSTSGKNLSGAVYEVYAAANITAREINGAHNEKTLYYKDDLVATLTTTYSGVAEGKLMVGSYYVKEKNAPGGYLVNATEENVTIVENQTATLTATDTPKTGKFVVTAKKVIPGGYKIKDGQFSFKLYMLAGSLDTTNGAPALQDLGVTVKNKADGTITFPEFTVDAESKISYTNDAGQNVSVQSSYAGEIQFAIKEVAPANEKTLSNQDPGLAADNGRYTYDDTVVYVVGAITESESSLNIKLEYEYGMGDFTYCMQAGTSVDAKTIENEIKSHLTEDEIAAYHMNLTLNGVTASEKAKVRVKNSGNKTWTVSMADNYSGESAILLRYLDNNGNEYDVPVMVLAKEGQSEAIFCNIFNAPFEIPAPTKSVTGGTAVSETVQYAGRDAETRTDLHNKVRFNDTFQYDIYQEIPAQTKANYFKSFVMKDTLPAGIKVTEQDVKVYRNGTDVTSMWKVNVTHDSQAKASDQQYSITATCISGLDDAAAYGVTYDFRYTVKAGQEVASKRSYYNHASIEIIYKDIESMFALDTDGNVRTDSNDEMTYEAFTGYDNVSNDRGVDKKAGNFNSGTALESSLNDKFESKTVTATTANESKAVYQRTTNEVQTDIYARLVPPDTDDKNPTSTWEIEKRVFNADGDDIDTDDVHIGDILTYVIYVRNNATVVNAHVTVTDALPSNVTFVDGDNGVVNSNGTLTWNNMDFDAGKLLTLTVHAKVNNGTYAQNIDNKATATVTPDEPTSDKSTEARNSTTQTSNTVHNYVPGIVKVVTDENGNNINGLFVNNGDTLYYHVFIYNTDTKGTDPYRTGIHTFETSDIVPDNSVLVGKAASGRTVSTFPAPGVPKLSMDGSKQVKECDNATFVSWTEEFKPGEIREYCFNVKAVGDGIDVLNQAETVKTKDAIEWNVYTEVVNGTITPDVRSIKPGSGTTVSYSPKSGYHIVSVTVDGKAVSTSTFTSKYEFKNINEDHYIKVVYAPKTSSAKTYTITTEVINGSISGDIVNIEPGSDEKVIYLPNPGYHIVSVTVDGKAVDVKTFEKGYAFDNVNADHHIKVVYEPDVAKDAYDKEEHTYESNEVINSTPLSVKKVMTLEGKDINKSFFQVGDTYYYTISVFNNAHGTKKYTITDVLPANITVTSIDDGTYIGSREGTAEYEITKTTSDPLAEDSKVATEVGTHSLKDNTITWVAELGPNEVKAFTFTFIPDTKEDEFVNDAHVKIDQWATDPTTMDPIPNAPDIPKEVDTNEVINWTPADPVKTVTRKTDLGDGKYEIQDMDTALVWGENADTLNYRISFSNNSDLKKTFKITDKIDTDITFMSASGNGNYDDSTRVITWTVDMEPKSEAYVTFDAKVNVGNSIASANNYATLIIDEAYPDSNETDTDIDETPTKTVYDASGNDIDQFLVNKSDELTYTIRVKNPDELTKRFTVKDIVPENTELLSVKKAVFELNEWSTGSTTDGKSTYTVVVAPGSTKALTQDQVNSLTEALGLTLVSFEDATAKFTSTSEDAEGMISSMYKVIGEGYKITGELLEKAGTTTAADSSFANYALVDGVNITDGTTHRYNISSEYTSVVGENIPSGKYVVTSNGKGGYIEVHEADGTRSAVYQIGSPKASVTIDTERFKDATKLTSGSTIDLSKNQTISVLSEEGLVAYLTVNSEYDAKEKTTTGGDISTDAIAAAGAEIVWTCDIPSNEQYAFTFTVRTLKKDTYIPNEATVSVDKSSIKTNLVENWIPDDPMKAVTQDSNDVSEKVFFRPDEEHFTYEIQVKNPSGLNKKFTVTDKLDKDLTFVKASDGGKVDKDNVVTWTLNLAGGETKTVTVEVYIKSSTAKSKIVNTADISSDEFHYTSNTVVVYITDPPVKAVNNSTSATKTSGKSVKNINGGLVFTGDNYSYTITWENPTEQTQIYTVTDALPEQVEFVAASDSGSETDGVVTWKNISVAAGKTKTVSVVVKVKKGYEEKQIDNIANVSYTTKGDLYKHDTNKVTVYVGSIKKAVTDTQNGSSIYGEIVAQGQHFFYDIFVSNVSEKDQSVVVTDTIDSKLSIIEASDEGSVSGQTITWEITIPKGGKHLYVEVTPVKNASTTDSTSTTKSSSGTSTNAIKNTAKVKNDTTGGEIKSNEVINFLIEAPVKSVKVTGKAETATEKSTSTTKTSSSGKTSSSSSKSTAATVGTENTTGLVVGAGDEVTYTITFKNPADKDKTFTITDKIDQSLTVTKVNDGGRLGLNGVITWTKTVAAGAETSVSFVATVPVGKNAVNIDNTATMKVDSVTIDSVPSNTVTVSVNPATDEQLEAENPSNPVKKVVKTVTKTARNLNTILMGDADNYTGWFVILGVAMTATAAVVIVRARKRRLMIED